MTALGGKQWERRDEKPPFEACTFVTAAGQLAY